MKLEEIAVEASQSPHVGDEQLAAYAKELLDAGEAEMAIATLLECAPAAFPPERVDELEASVDSSKEWGYSAIQQAVEQYRARAQAA